MTDPEVRWGPAPPRVSLGNRDIHVWHVDLDLPGDIPLSAWWRLSADEQERAYRFRFVRDRRRFAIGRLALRTVLAGYLWISPSKVRFRYGSRGKPFLAENHNADIAFNLSHSGGVALVAVARGCRLGVDVEQTRPIDAGEIVNRYFSPRERREFWAVAPEQRHDAFFRCWTRKEAFAKAVGDGLALALDHFETRVAPGEAVEFSGVAGDGAAAKEWTFWDMNPPHPRTVGAIAVEGLGWTVSCWALGDVWGGDSIS